MNVVVSQWRNPPPIDPQPWTNEEIAQFMDYQSWEATERYSEFAAKTLPKIFEQGYCDLPTLVKADQISKNILNFKASRRDYREAREVLPKAARDTLCRGANAYTQETFKQLERVFFVVEVVSAYHEWHEANEFNFKGNSLARDASELTAAVATTFSKREHQDLVRMGVASGATWITKKLLDRAVQLGILRLGVGAGTGGTSSAIGWTVSWLAGPALQRYITDPAHKALFKLNAKFCADMEKLGNMPRETPLTSYEREYKEAFLAERVKSRFEFNQQKSAKEPKPIERQVPLPLVPLSTTAVAVPADPLKETEQKIAMTAAELFVPSKIDLSDLAQTKVDFSSYPSDDRPSTPAAQTPLSKWEVLLLFRKMVISLLGPAPSQ